MNKNKWIGVAVIALVVILLIVKPWQQQSVPTSGGAAASTANSMTMRIDGSRTSFQLTSTQVSTKMNQIIAYYTAYNPRGDVAYKATLTFDSNITPGNYKSGSSNNKTFRLTLSEHKGNTYYAHAASAAAASDGSDIGSRSADWVNGVRSNNGNDVDVGSYSLNLSYRSDDWRTYSGSFSAFAEAGQYGGSYASVEITDAQFNFTLE